MAKGKTVQRRTRSDALENNELFPKFAELYVEYKGNAKRAAIDAGYSESYAQSSSYKLVARLQLKMGPVLRRFGLDEVKVAHKVEQLLEAKTPKWNPESKGWDVFEDGGTQQRALDTLADLLDARPPRKLAGDTPDGSIPIRIISSIPKREARVQ